MMLPNRNSQSRLILKTKKVLLLLIIISAVISVYCSKQKDGVKEYKFRDFIKNASMEDGLKEPEIWKEVIFWKSDADPDFSWSKEGRNGSKCLKIRSDKKTGAGWGQHVTLDPDGYYELSGWVKTEQMTPSEGGVAILIPQLRWVSQTIIHKDTDWKKITIKFHNAGFYKITLLCLLGVETPASGIVWFDDIELKQRVKYGSDRGLFPEFKSDQFSVKYDKLRGNISSISHKIKKSADYNYLPDPDTLHYLDKKRDHWLGDVALDLRLKPHDKLIRVNNSRSTLCKIS